MRFYRADGTFQDFPSDTEFGWYLKDVAIDEGNPAYTEHNDQLKTKAKLTRDWARSLNAQTETTAAAAAAASVDESAEALESLECCENHSRCREPEGVMDLVKESRAIRRIDPKIHEEKPIGSSILPHTVEGLTDNLYEHKLPSKETFVSLVNPVNAEGKALLSVISYGRYQRLDDRRTKRDLMGNVDFKATNSQRLIVPNRRDFRLMKNANGTREESAEQIRREIRNYHATKEDNMLSLMMELLNTDMDGNLEDVSDEGASSTDNSNNGATMETSDLGNSIQSSIVSREGSAKKKTFDVPIDNRTDVLNSIGLGFDIDKSIASFREEKAEMRAQLNAIKSGFETLDRKVKTLSNGATILENELKETAYLDNLIHLLNGDLDKVKRARLPFRMFRESLDHDDDDANYIV